MTKLKSLAVLTGAAVLGAVAITPLPASANLISCATGTLNCNLGSTENFTANFNATTIGGTTAQLEATAFFENFVFSNNGSTLTFQIVLTNTTPQGSLSAADWDSIRLTALGFNTQPDATTVTGTSSPNDFNTFTETNFPSFMTVDLCESSGSNCPGGASGGLSPNGAANMNAPDHTSTISLTLTGLGQFNAGTGSIDLGCDLPGGCTPELYDVKFQTAFGSFEFQNTSSTVIPELEPGSLALLGTALAGLGFFSHRQRG
jgi:hypothetical protein